MSWKESQWTGRMVVCPWARGLLHKPGRSRSLVGHPVKPKLDGEFQVPVDWLVFRLTPCSGVRFLRKFSDFLKKKQKGQKGLDSPKNPVIISRRCEGTLECIVGSRSRWRSLTSEGGRVRIPARSGTGNFKTVPQSFGKLLDRLSWVCYTFRPVVGSR